MKKIGICNNKGGVGKTTICFCLAGAFAETGRRVLVVDMDQQGSLSSSLISNFFNLQHVVTNILTDTLRTTKKVIRKTKLKNIDIIPANSTLQRLESELLSDRDAHYHLADKIDEVESYYDIILFDSPPRLGLAAWSVLTASQGIIIPLEAQDYSVKGVGQLHSFIDKVRKRANPSLTILGYVISRYDGRRKIEQDFHAMIQRHLGERVFQQELKDSVRYAEAVTLGRPITQFAPKSEHAEAIRRSVKEVLDAQKR